ncbi:hypothetical protein [Lysobacter sp. TY2-98]|uniref:hypothetical protein n=1 Tax=Lysobacter sp. TY2-98 TaxID=2290922 RepID=UPI0013B445A8|nr:hypothetical protein [Lysobacter sp. TY2-98]
MTMIDRDARRRHRQARLFLRLLLIGSVVLLIYAAMSVGNVDAGAPARASR